MNDNQSQEVQTNETEEFRLRTIVSDQDILDLRKESEPVDFVICDNSGNPVLTNDVKRLIQTLKDYVTENDGLGMAAVQLGVHKRLFVMRKPFSSDNLLVVINPRIIRVEGHSTKPEGCFSLPDIPAEAMVTRASRVVASYSDENGVEHLDELFVGMDARVFLHEYDHLDGILMIDKKGKRMGFRGWRR